LQPGTLAFAFDAGVAGIALAALALAPWLAVAPNRLLPGQPIAAVDALGAVSSAALASSLVAAVAMAHSRASLAQGVALGLFSSAFLAQLVATGTAAAGLLVGRAPAARVMLGSGFWIFVGALLVLTSQAALRRGRYASVATVLVLCAGLTLLASIGLLDGLSLALEYHGRADQLHAAVARHLWLALTALGLSFVVTAPLAWLAFHAPRAEAVIGGIMSAVQVMPAIALFGLLVPLLSLLLHAVPTLRAAGLQAIGPTPAVIGIAAYLSLPLLRALVATLRAADPATIEAARAMGMGEARLTWDVRVPLGLPILSAGVRIAAVQSIGLTALAALIGAGGLGAIIFEGMAQFAADLILLGALPVIALALLTDALLRVLETSVSRRKP
jgi:osmoprotectant transport system permease protein